ncbi:UNVERIFIED_CONTAM: Retrovirus-related Pol polyprotein from transposon RE1 [Sesamum latifolium]|uniref:Retrovirus-related Pol polyprotein from transposon RE1 n=1 Tax=Sesamum latifolium TaxID=2727402 RepID=A0AAW2UVW2_9LAMI
MHDEWRNAMKEEMMMIEKNRTWSLVPIPRNKHVIGVKWIFRAKLNSDGSVNKYKARLVVKGYSQLAGVDYGDTFAPMARHETKKSCLLNNLKVSRSIMEEIECINFIKHCMGLSKPQEHGNDNEMIEEFKEEIKRRFEMFDLGHITYFLEVRKGDDADASLYRSLIGSLLYLTTTRPDLMYAVGVLSRFMQLPGQVHMEAAKRLLRYVKGTHDYEIWYTQSEDLKLFGYADSDWAGCPDDLKSTTGYVFSLGSGVFSSLSKKQEVVAQSTAEAEYMASAAAANQAIWLRSAYRFTSTSSLCYCHFC